MRVAPVQQIPDIAEPRRSASAKNHVRAVKRVRSADKRVEAMLPIDELGGTCPCRPAEDL